MNTLVWQRDEDMRHSAVQTLAGSSVYFLQNHPWTSEVDNELITSLVAARFILHAADQGCDVIGDLSNKTNVCFNSQLYVVIEELASSVSRRLTISVHGLFYS